MNSDEDTGSSVLMVVAGIAIMAGMAVSAAMAAVRQANDPMAHIGDIIAFNRPVDILPPRNVVARLATPAGGECTLDLQKLSNGGGSLVVEALADAERMVYRLHWAGPAGSDCGSVADLLIGADDMDNLAAAAGGFGVDRKTLALGTPVNTAFAPN